MSDKMSCGHEYRYISRSDERTNFCVWCEWQATVAELAQLRAANAELQLEIKELHERAAAENSEITNCLKNIAELVTQRRGLEVELSDARAALAQAQAERDAAMIEVNDLRMSGSLLANQMVCTCGGGLSKLLGCLECGTRYELISSDRLKRITDKLRVYEIASENAPPFSASSFEAVSYAIAQRDAATEKALELQGAITALNNLCNMTAARAEQAESKLRDFSDQSMPCSESDATAWVVYVPTRALDDWRSLVTRANRAEQAEAVLSEQADIITANLWHIPPEYAARNILLDVAMKMRAALAGPEGGPR